MFKHLKNFIIVIVLTFSFISSVYALTYDLNNGFTINNITIDYNLIDDIWSNVEGKTQHELNNAYSDTTYIYHRENLPYMYIQPTAYNNDVLIFFSPINVFDNYFYWNNSYNYNIALLDSDKVIRIDIYNNDYYYDFDNSIQINNSGGYYPQKALTSFDFYINNTLTLSKSYDYVTSSLPSYLEGYKKITLTTEDKYYMLSGLSSGSVYIGASDFEEFGGRLSYYDNDLSSQTYDSYIQDYTLMDDELFVRQDFDLSSYFGADFVMFSKYIYLEGEDNITYDIWVPDDMYNSNVTITPNNHGGNDFDYEYIDENGVVQNGQVSSVDLSQYSLEFNSKEGSIYKAKSLLVSLKDMNYIWNSSFDTFYNNLPELVQLFLIFFFNIIMILICLKLVGWKE